MFSLQHIGARVMIMNQQDASSLRLHELDLEAQSGIETFCDRVRISLLHLQQIGQVALLLIGARQWINHNHFKAVESHLDIDLLEADGLAKFVAATNTTALQLRHMGSKALDKGAALLSVDATLNYDDLVFNVFRSVDRDRRDWQELDPTVPYSDDDEAERYKTAPRWSQLNCALGCVVYVAVQLNIGRIKADQMSLQYRINELGTPAQALLHLVSKPLSRISDKNLTLAVEKLRHLVYSVDPKVFPLDGLLPITEILQQFFGSIPQLSFTRVAGARCGGEDQYSFLPVRPAEAIVGTGIELTALPQSDRTMGDHINEVLTYLATSIRPTGQTCEKHGYLCMEVQRTDYLVLDDLPPTLLVYLPGGISRTEAEKCHLFDDISLSYRHVFQGTCNKNYSVKGVLMWLGESHFIVRWKKTSSQNVGQNVGQLEIYDSLGDPPTNSANFWWERTPRQKAVTLIYHQSNIL